MSKIKIELELDLMNPRDLKAFNAISGALSDYRTPGLNIPETKETVEEEEVKKPKKAATKKVIKKEPEVKEEDEEEDNPFEYDEEETLTIEEVRSTLATAKRSGKPNDQIKAILQEYGTTLVSGLDPKHYAVVVKKVKAL